MADIIFTDRNSEKREKEAFLQKLALANYYANGRQVRGYHIVNVALHCACSVLVAVIARRVMRIAALHACLAAMLFAAHPVHTEAVSSIVGRAEVLCCFFFLLSFLCYHW
ncbi:hypothetical protein MTO96_051847 [Rhipicephalus appendiculatus]